MAFKGKNLWFRSGLKVGSWLADAVRYCFGFLGSRVSQGGLELTYGVAWGCFRAYFLDVFWKSISTLFRGCDWEWICEEFWLLFWRPWPRFLASQWNFFGRRFGIFFFFKIGEKVDQKMDKIFVQILATIFVQNLATGGWWIPPKCYIYIYAKLNFWGSQKSMILERFLERC